MQIVHVLTSSRRQTTEPILCRRFCAAIRALSRPRQEEAVDKALRVLDLVAPELPTSVLGALGREETDGHARVIHTCMKDLVRADVNKRFRERSKSLLRILCGEDNEYDHLLVLQLLHRRGILLGPVAVSRVLSSCGAVGDLGTGVQLQALSVKTCLVGSLPVVSALISLYSKCGRLGCACKLFDETPVRNTVLYTSIIATFAQHCWFESCVEVFADMRRWGSEPNDYTFASVLSACVDAGCIGVGTSVHGLEMQMGYDSYVHVSNALISMYAKCGRVNDASYVFRKMKTKDLISWNSMISGYAQYGFAENALVLLEEMRQTNVRPDAITFLGVLSSCRHSGLVEQGRRCFSIMREHGIDPDLDHYSCIVDLLGRAGLLEEAYNFIIEMPIPPNAVIWGSLLSSCKVHGNIHMGILAAHSRLLLDPGCAATHIQLANLYAALGCWDNFANIRKSIKERGLKINPGCSWIEVGNVIHKFKAEGRSNMQVSESTIMLDYLDDHMKGFNDSLEINIDLLDEEIYG